MPRRHAILSVFAPTTYADSDSLRRAGNVRIWDSSSHVRTLGIQWKLGVTDVNHATRHRSVPCEFTVSGEPVINQNVIRQSLPHNLAVVR